MSNKETQLDELLAAAKQGDVGVTPPDELWGQIEDRLEPQPGNNARKSVWLGAGLSAMAAGIMAVAVVIGLTHNRAQPDVGSDWYLLAEQMNQAQQQQVQGMLAGYQLGGYQPLSGANNASSDITQQLTQLQQSKQQLIRSMQTNGGNAQMLELLRWINQQELRLLQQAYQQPQLEAI